MTAGQKPVEDRTASQVSLAARHNEPEPPQRNLAPLFHRKRSMLQGKHRRVRYLVPRPSPASRLIENAGKKEKKRERGRSTGVAHGRGREGREGRGPRPGWREGNGTVVGRHASETQAEADGRPSSRRRRTRPAARTRSRGPRPSGRTEQARTRHERRGTPLLALAALPDAHRGVPAGEQR